jgi:hypothetical protein
LAQAKYIIKNALRLAVKLRRWRNEARFAREARLRRVKYLPKGKCEGTKGENASFPLLILLNRFLHRKKLPSYFAKQNTSFIIREAYIIFCEAKYIIVKSRHGQTVSAFLLIFFSLFYRGVPLIHFHRGSI